LSTTLNLGLPFIIFSNASFTFSNGYSSTMTLTPARLDPDPYLPFARLGYLPLDYVEILTLLRHLRRFHFSHMCRS
jgi:hypothetical protein